VVPLFNDAKSVVTLVSKMTDYLGRLEVSYELVLVDDGSPDKTADALAELTEGRADIVALAMERNVGQTRAIVAGLRIARGEVVVTMDSDLETGLDIIPRLIEAISDGAELACGRREGRASLLHRTLGSFFANALSRWLFGARITDFGCGTNAGSRALLDRWLADPFGERFVKLGLLRLATRIVEVSVDLRAVPPEQRLLPEAGARAPSRYRLRTLLREVFGLLWFRVHPRQRLPPARARLLSSHVSEVDRASGDT
jgi:glycosyltransferase involved in cell wall biosynthesis